MSAPLDPIKIARSVVADPRKMFTASQRGIAAVCQALVESVDQPQSILPTELVEAARALIRAEAEATMAKDAEGYAPLKVGLAREQAFLTFKVLFEQEFPNE